jgi:hypothetical protein
MSTAQVESQPKGPHSNGRTRIDSRDFARRIKAVFSQIPSALDEEIEHRPQVALAVAFALGAGAGVLLSSRILRSALASVVSYAAIELGRSYLSDALAWRGEPD